MQPKATTVKGYLADLPADRRAALEAVRAVILKNLDKGFEEGVQYGMIGYYVPHSIFPAGYHCDPKQPLPCAALGSQKNHMSLHLMAIYGDPELNAWFTAAWKKTGKKLDMGKACVRFKKVEDLALDVIGELFRRATAAKYIGRYQATLATMAKKPTAKTNVAKKPVTKKTVAKKTVAKKTSNQAKR